MNNPKKSVIEYKQSKPEQLQLFELGLGLEDYSNSIELYDTMPKFYIGGVERERGVKVDSLPIYYREFFHRNKQYSLSIAPAAIYEKKTGKTISYYPSQREELVEDALRKIATKGRVMQFDNKKESDEKKDDIKKVGVRFTYYEVQQELEKMGHGYSIAEIKLAVEILSKATMEITSKDGNEIAITSAFFPEIGKETKENGGKEKVFVTFHMLVTKSINQKTYRLFNYDKLMKMKMPLSRWLHKRISHLFVQATPANPYQIKLETIVRDSGMKSYKTVSERMRQVEKAFNELKKNKVISEWRSVPEREKNKILDVLYSLYMSEEFVSDAKKANKLTNLRLENEREEKEVFDMAELRKEIENPIYGLSQTMINNYLEKISSKKERDSMVTTLEAVKEYIELRKKENKPITNNAAITRSAIKDGTWIPRASTKEIYVGKQEKSPEEIELNKKEMESKIRDHEMLQINPDWLKIRKKIKEELGEENWEKWFSGIEVLSISENEIIFVAKSKFIRDWIIREFQVDLEDSVKLVLPEVKKVKIVHVTKTSEY